MTEVQDIIEYFDRLPNTVADTEKGIFGTSKVEICAAFFKDIKLDTKRHFVDLGSGDGRIAILASLFTRATGIEFDKDLTKQAQEHNTTLGTDAKLLNIDYETYDFSDVDVIFGFFDHDLLQQFIEKLQQEFNGTLYSYQNIFKPEGLHKGKTYWYNGVPIVSYTTKLSE